MNNNSKHTSEVPSPEFIEPVSVIEEDAPISTASSLDAALDACLTAGNAPVEVELRHAVLRYQASPDERREELKYRCECLADGANEVDSAKIAAVLAAL